MVKNNFLPLDLKESLFFETGYEIGEMVSVSLDPEISIQKFSDYVSIRGVISLEGEYVKLTEWPDDYEEKKNERVEHIYRSVAKIATDTDDRVSFYHHFPIEISVPFERITKLDDVTVSVEAFDYTLHDINEMNVAATLHINGIGQSQQQQTPKEKAEKSSVALGDTVQFEIVKNEQIQKKEKPTEQPQSEPIKDVANEDEKILTRVEQLQAKREKEIKENVEEIEEPKQVETRTIEDEPVTNTSTEEETERQDDDHEPSMTGHELEVVEKNEHIDEKRDPINITEQIDITNDESSEDELKDVLYLAEMFNDDDDEEDAYQMRLRIVQEDESLLEIADRYEISAQKIININNLDDDHVVAGQLLLIPFSNDD